jgi:hypothetical protein
MMNSERLLFAGDVVLDRAFKFGEEFKKLCENHSLKVFNLEAPFTVANVASLKAGPNIASRGFFYPLGECFDVATLANNHTMDYGSEGLDATLAKCSEYGIVTVGAGSNLDEAFRPLYMRDCCIISVAEHEFGAAREDKSGIATVDQPLRLYRAMRKGKGKGKFVVVVAHGGSEIIEIPPPYLRERYKLWIEYGADLVIGGHPHVVQGREIYQGKSIFYSLGNFVFPSWPEYSEYPNSCWSIAVSVEVSSGVIEVIPIAGGVRDIFNVSRNPEYEKEFGRLSNLITSGDYCELYRKISTELYTGWYGRLSTTDANDAALLLHYLRCDAHKNMIQTALSRKMGES